MVWHICKGPPKRLSIDKQALFNTVENIHSNVENIVGRVKVFEPEYCYIMGIILYYYSDRSKDQVLNWFVDSVYLAELYRQINNYNYFRESFRQLNILDTIDRRIIEKKKKSTSE